MFKNCTSIKSAVVFSVAFLCLTAHMLVAQQTTGAFNRYTLYSKLKNTRFIPKGGVSPSQKTLSAVKSATKSITKKCYTIKSPCGDIDATYTAAIIDFDGMPIYLSDNEQGAYIVYNSMADTPGWYWYNDGESSDALYFNASSSETLPLDGWIYGDNNCGVADDPVSLTVSETTCGTFDLCREVVTECGTFGGQYKQVGTYYGKPLFSKDDFSSVIFYVGGGWMIFSGFSGPPSAMIESEDDLPPATGWMGLDLACEEDAQISVKNCGCTPAPADALNSLVVNTLSATNCPVNIRLPVYGNMGLITGPDNYLFSSVYRKPGPYLMNINGIKKPGTYTVTVSAANECGEITSKVVTFVVNGQGCK